MLLPKTHSYPLLDLLQRSSAEELDLPFLFLNSFLCSRASESFPSRVRFFFSFSVCVSDEPKSTDLKSQAALGPRSPLKPYGPLSPSTPSSVEGFSRWGPVPEHSNGIRNSVQLYRKEP